MKRTKMFSCFTFFQKALSTGMYFDNANVLEDFALVLLEIGQHEEAKELLLQCVQLSPSKGHTKYMSLGQLCGKDIDIYILYIFRYFPIFYFSLKTSKWKK
jgi:Tfp pilus assembly protein PilF